MEHPQKIIILGAGNLAWHLGPALQDAGYDVIQVFSRSQASASSLGERLAVQWTTDAGKLDPAADMLLYCVTDRALPDLFCSLELGKRLMVHTSGSIPADVFRGISKDYGVLYPMMTFTKDRNLDLRKIPICFEGNNERSLEILEKMAGRMSNRVIRMDSEQRKKLHMAAIIASNFSNHMYRLSEDFLQDAGMDFSLLRPLIEETVAKAMEIGPEAAMTGPARRQDIEVIQEHIDQLKDRPELQKLYTFVSDSISNHFRSE